MQYRFLIFFQMHCSAFFRYDCRPVDPLAEIQQCSFDGIRYFAYIMHIPGKFIFRLVEEGEDRLVNGIVDGIQLLDLPA